QTSAAAGTNKQAEGPSPPVFCQFGAALAGGTALSHLETPVRRVHGDVMPRRHQDNTTRPVLCSMLVLSPHARSHVRSHARSSWSVLRSQFMSRGEDRVLQWPDMYHIRKHRAEQQLSLKKHPRQGRRGRVEAGFSHAGSGFVRLSRTADADAGTNLPMPDCRPFVLRVPSAQPRSCRASLRNRQTSYA
ncbi:hypothetical protein BN1708_001660, partial [Verticillium longisporum]